MGRWEQGAGTGLGSRQASGGRGASSLRRAVRPPHPRAARLHTRPTCTPPQEPGAGEELGALRGAVRFGDGAAIGNGFFTTAHGGAIETALDEATAELVRRPVRPPLPAQLPQRAQRSALVPSSARTAARPHSSPPSLPPRCPPSCFRIPQAKCVFSPLVSTRDISFALLKPVPLHASLAVRARVKEVRAGESWVLACGQHGPGRLAAASACSQRPRRRRRRSRTVQSAAGRAHVRHSIATPAAALLHGPPLCFPALHLQVRGIRCYVEGEIRALGDDSGSGNGGSGGGGGADGEEGGVAVLATCTALLINIREFIL